MPSDPWDHPPNLGVFGAGYLWWSFPPAGAVLAAFNERLDVARLVDEGALASGTSVVTRLVAGGLWPWVGT